MPRVTIIPADSTIVVDQVAVTVPFPDIDQNVHALQYDPEDDLLRFELKRGARDPARGEEAAAIIRPFIEAHAAEVARVAAAAVPAPKPANEAIPNTPKF